MPFYFSTVFDANGAKVSKLGLWSHCKHWASTIQSFPQQLHTINILVHRWGFSLHVLSVIINRIYIMASSIRIG